jgi:hypothetical protein
MVKHLTHKFGGPFHWDGQQSFDTRREAEDDWRLVAKRRDVERHMDRVDKFARVELTLREAFPKRGG